MHGTTGASWSSGWATTLAKYARTKRALTAPSVAAGTESEALATPAGRGIVAEGDATRRRTRPR